MSSLCFLDYSLNSPDHLETKGYKSNVPRPSKVGLEKLGQLETACSWHPGTLLRSETFKIFIPAFMKTWFFLNKVASSRCFHTEIMLRQFGLSLTCPCVPAFPLLVRSSTESHRVLSCWWFNRCWKKMRRGQKPWTNRGRYVYKRKVQVKAWKVYLNVWTTIPQEPTTHALIGSDAPVWFLPNLGPPVVPCYPFLGEGSPNYWNRLQKKGYPDSNLSTGGSSNWYGPSCRFRERMRLGSVCFGYKQELGLELGWMASLGCFTFLPFRATRPLPSVPTESVKCDSISKGWVTGKYRKTSSFECFGAISGIPAAKPLDLCRMDTQRWVKLGSLPIVSCCLPSTAIKRHWIVTQNDRQNPCSVWT